MTEQEITEKAIKEAKKMKKEVASKLVDAFPLEDLPVSVFMAGSPGAGKTETARAIEKSLKIITA